MLRLSEAVGAANVSSGADINVDDTHDEALGLVPGHPLAVVRPATTDDVVAVVNIATEFGLPITARGSGTGLSGAAAARDGALIIAFDRMNRVLEIDPDNGVAVVEPGITLAELDEATKEAGLIYPISPGESSASLGGNVNTNAGGMRAVKYGVTRHQVLGLECVLASGDVIQTGGKFVKATSGYDLTQLIVGSEGTLALVTKIVLKLVPRPRSHAVILAPFLTLTSVSQAVPKVVMCGVGPLMLEYLDMMGMAATTQGAGMDLGIPDDIKEQALAYLVVVLEGNDDDRIGDDAAQVAEVLSNAGALDVYMLPVAQGRELIDAREKAFWTAKAHGANDIVDVVVPRASMGDYVEAVAQLAAQSQALVAGAGHAGDGNVHLSVFQPDPEKLHVLMMDILATGVRLGGAISAEHGIGVEKKPYFMALEDPVKIDLMRSIKKVFDPDSILNPGVIFDLAD
ncbi:MAG: FAD-binding protein [Actinobacteria bacterium]|nr:FAD-binding protein [Actinomycetota bacterium]MCB9390961.1 FAD-binding protein [Acidimicrobiia bacterium]